MTPLETQLRFPEYTIPGEYLTPITSPALEAQGPNPNSYPFHTRQVSEMGFVSSSTDASAAVPATSAQSSPGVVRKHRRRQSSARLSARAGKPSPSVRPQTRKKPMLNINSGEILNGLYQENGSQRPPSSSNGLRVGGNESSGQDSVSPEPLSEPLMPPPALPQMRKSPALGPSGPQATEPATPATLMRIRNPGHQHDPEGQFGGHAQLVPGESPDDVMEDVLLPEAATATSTKPPSKNPRISTSGPAADAANSTRSASVTPSLEPRSGSINKAPSSVVSSPCVDGTSPRVGPAGKKSDTRSGAPRKRQSMSSSQTSPPLKPKISPSIKPMLRNDGKSPVPRSCSWKPEQHGSNQAFFLPSP